MYRYLSVNPLQLRIIYPKDFFLHKNIYPNNMIFKPNLTFPFLSLSGLLALLPDRQGNVSSAAKDVVATGGRVPRVSFPVAVVALIFS